MKFSYPKPLFYLHPQGILKYSQNTLYLVETIPNPFPSSTLIIENPFIRFVPLSPLHPKTFKNFLQLKKTAHLTEKIERKNSLLHAKISLFGKKYLALFPQSQKNLDSFLHAKKISFVFWPLFLLKILEKLLPFCTLSDKETFLFFIYGKTSGLRQFVFLNKTLILTRFHEAQKIYPSHIKERLQETCAYIERLSHESFHNIAILGIIPTDIRNSILNDFSSVSFFSEIDLEKLLSLDISPSLPSYSIESLCCSFFQKYKPHRSLICKKSLPLKRLSSAVTQLFYGVSAAFILASFYFGWDAYQISKTITSQTLHLQKSLLSLQQTRALFPEYTYHLQNDLLDQATLLAKKQLDLYKYQKEPLALLSTLLSHLDTSWKIHSISWDYGTHPPQKVTISINIEPIYSFDSLEKNIENIENLKRSLSSIFTKTSPYFSITYPKKLSTSVSPSPLFPITLTLEKKMS